MKSSLNYRLKNLGPLAYRLIQERRGSARSIATTIPVYSDKSPMINVLGLYGVTHSFYPVFTCIAGWQSSNVPAESADFSRHPVRSYVSPPLQDTSPRHQTAKCLSKYPFRENLIYTHHAWRVFVNLFFLYLRLMLLECNGYWIYDAVV